MGPLPSLSSTEEQGLAALQARWRGFNTRRRLGKGHTKRYAPAFPSLCRIKTPQVCCRYRRFCSSCLPVAHPRRRNVSPDCTRPPACRGFPTCLASDSRSVRCGVCRHRIAEELLITEDTYVKGLRSLVTLYIQPMREMLGTPEEVRAPPTHPTVVLGLLLAWAAVLQPLGPVLYCRSGYRASARIVALESEPLCSFGRCCRRRRSGRCSARRRPS